MSTAGPIRSWLRCYRCWSQDLEVQVHYEGIHRIDPQTGERAEVVDELQEAVVQCLECMHDQPHLTFANGRVEAVEDRWRSPRWPRSRARRPPPRTGTERPLPQRLKFGPLVARGHRAQRGQERWA